MRVKKTSEANLSQKKHARGGKDAKRPRNFKIFSKNGQANLFVLQTDFLRTERLSEKVDKNHFIMTQVFTANLSRKTDKRQKMRIVSLLALAPFALGCSVSSSNSRWDFGSNRPCEWRNYRTNECLYYKK